MECKHKPVGRNILCDFFSVRKQKLEDVNSMISVLREAAEKSGCTPLKTVSHVFDTGGFSAGILISESHFWIHTYPEEGVAFLDIFTCGENALPLKGKEHIKNYLGPCRERMLEIERGKTVPEKA